MLESILSLRPVLHLRSALTLPFALLLLAFSLGAASLPAAEPPARPDQPAGAAGAAGKSDPTAAAMEAARNLLATGSPTGSEKALEAAFQRSRPQRSGCQVVGERVAGSAVSHRPSR